MGIVRAIRTSQENVGVVYDERFGVLKIESRRPSSTPRAMDLDLDSPGHHGFYALELIRTARILHLRFVENEAHWELAGIADSLDQVPDDLHVVYDILTHVDRNLSGGNRPYDTTENGFSRQVLDNR